MRRPTLMLTLAGILCAATPLGAQEVELPEYTMEQRWQRLAFNTVSWEAAVVALGEAHGMTPEEVGTWMGEFFSQGWLGGAEAPQFLRSMYRNLMAFPGASGEVVASTPTSVTARFNNPVEARLLPPGTLGVARDEIVTMLESLEATIADYVGVDMERTDDGEYDLITLQTRYGPIVASNQIRWNRGSYLSWLTSLQLMSLRKESGMTAREIGEADAELYGPTWTAPTPWRFFRGMVWNMMTDPGTDCEVSSASPDEVRARCLQSYRDLVAQNQERFNVTPEDIFDANTAFAAGVAEYLGLRWNAVSEDGYTVITVTKR